MARKHLRLAYWCVRKMGFDRRNSDYEDVCGEALLALTIAIDEFRGDYGCKFSTFACKCIRHRLIGWIRKEKRQVTTIQVEFELEGMDPPIREEAAIGEAERLLLMIDNERRQKALRLRYLEGRSYRSIGKAFKITGCRARQIAKHGLMDIRSTGVKPWFPVERRAPARPRGRHYSECDDGAPQFEDAVRAIEDHEGGFSDN